MKSRLVFILLCAWNYSLPGSTRKNSVMIHNLIKHKQQKEAIVKKLQIKLSHSTKTSKININKVIFNAFKVKYCFLN